MCVCVCVCVRVRVRVRACVYVCELHEFKNHKNTVLDAFAIN